jgi:drug/metabolite transporter superfamily protein YnfA
LISLILFAACGGVYIALSLFWLRAVVGARTDLRDFHGRRALPGWRGRNAVGASLNSRNFHLHS